MGMGRMRAGRNEGVGSEYRIGEGNSVTAANHPLLRQQAATQYYTVKTYTVKSTKKQRTEIIQYTK